MFELDSEIVVTLVNSISDLHHQLQHLLRSQEELRSFIEENSIGKKNPTEDLSEFTLAISENNVVIERKKEKIKSAMTELQKIDPLWQQHLGDIALSAEFSNVTNDSTQAIPQIAECHETNSNSTSEGVYL